MQNRLRKDILEVIGVVSVVASLIFVGIEIRQSTVLARGQLISDFYDRVYEFHAARQDSDFARTWAKATENPDELTTDELVKLEAHLEMFISQYFADRWLYDIGIFEENDAFLAGFAPVFFGNEYAQAWWEVVKQDFDQRAVEEINQHIQNISSNQALDRYSRVRERLADQ